MSMINLFMTAFNIALLILLIVIFVRVMGNRFGLEKKVVKALWSISFILVTISPFVVPMRVLSKDEFRTLKFGFPFRFIEQHTFVDIPDREFPFYVTLINPWGPSLSKNLNIELGSYALSYVFLYFALYLCAYAVTVIIRWRKSKEH
ncbi:MAG: hypothetical protein N2484_14080 [Clostridia bacterium]|nr:hypothetical protein [Clostridia bacterium]